MVRAESAMRQVQQTNSAFQLQGVQQRAFFDSYLRCFRCDADTASLLPAKEAVAPVGVTIVGSVAERSEASRPRPTMPSRAAIARLAGTLPSAARVVEAP
jgi:hypothetical protein